MQAATAPLLLLALRVDQYAQWILVTAICSYLSLALNGPFYGVLNEITLAASRGRRRAAERFYALGLLAALGLVAVALILLVAALSLLSEPLAANVIPLCLGLVVQAAGFASIMFDANFRAGHRYAFGTNVLTIGRVADWALAVGLAFGLRDVTAVFAALAIYKVVQVLALAAWTARLPGSLSLGSAAPSRRDVRRLCGAARGQVVLSATNAASVMGPQIVVSLLYDPGTTVVFSVARTYLRLLSAGIAVVTAAAWPVMTELYARGDLARMRALLTTLQVRAVGVAAAGGLAMVALSPLVFDLLFRGRVHADPSILLPILGSVVVTCAISLDQSLFVATNLEARALGTSLGLTAAALLFMAGAAHRLPLPAILVTQVGFDLAVFFAMHRAVSALFESGASGATKGSHPRISRCRVFYFAPISTDEINARYGTAFVPGASTNKVLGVCAALRDAGVASVVVSGLVPARGRDLARCVTLHRQRGVPYAKVWSLGRAGVKRVTASLGYLAFALRVVRRQDRVLLYNFFPDYIPAALALRLLGRPAILDIEDAPPAGEPGPRGYMNRVSLRILRRLCAPRVVTVSHHLGRQLGLARYIPVHGIARPQRATPTAAARFGHERVAILFGGSITPETGLDLFATALRLLARRDPDLPARFLVTGHYPADRLGALKIEIEHASRITLELHAGLSTAAYRALLDEVAIGLSLKLPEGSLGQTTFPSKVIEYAAAGLLLVATPVSDVPTIFAGGAALILADAEPDTLARELAAALRDRCGSAEIAERGRLAVMHAMSGPEVGRRLAAFLFA